jgi:hypothetical protein
VTEQTVKQTQKSGVAKPHCLQNINKIKNRRGQVTIKVQMFVFVAVLVVNF